MTDVDTAGSDARRVSRLIELGRDQEAVELAIAQARTQDHSARREDGGGSMEPLDQLDLLGPLLAGVVGSITPNQLDAPTPCEKFTVRGVLEHMIGGATLFSAAYRGQVPSEPDTVDVLAGFGPTLTALAEAMHSPGALDRTIPAPFGEVPGATFARYVVLDGLLHGWDLATATGQRYEPPDALVAAADAYAHEAVDPLRDGETFAAAVEPEPSASPMERLAAYTGRRRLPTGISR